TELGRISQLVDQARDDESTPLEKRLQELARRLVWLTLVVAVLVTLTGLGSGKSWVLLLQTAIALAVATVPEGLPIIATLTLAQGGRRMADRNALVNRLSAVETLGATSVILTDKTGTLTENRMRVAAYWLPAGEVTLPQADPGGHGDPAALVPEGAPPPGTPSGDALRAQLTRALTASALCVSAELPTHAQEQPTGEGHQLPVEQDSEGVGDPTELALLRAARHAGLERSALLARYPEVRQEAFDSETRLM